ncbi:hypothetical protein COCON_G00020280 [Conger conger]|uniref:Uncharacterized protein n=1 Tax=Conger conger TaxID=82655 RepID=A0A9Q1DWS7_CONCO|nr:hypothetical protein COCON_G00020280 [Conger conger]
MLKPYFARDSPDQSVSDDSTALLAALTADEDGVTAPSRTLTEQTLLPWKRCGPDVFCPAPTWSLRGRSVTSEQRLHHCRQTGV